jgi:hypothetical protein
VSVETIEGFLRAGLDGRAGVFLRFGGASIVFSALAVLWRRTLSLEACVWAQVATSLVLLSLLATPAVTVSLVVHAVVLFLVIEWLPPGHPRTALVVAMLVTHVAIPVLWFPMLPDYGPKVRELVAFATNAGFLRAWSWARDRHRLPGRGVALLRDYAFYTFFLPSFVNGPFFSPIELDQRRTPSPDRAPLPEGGPAYAIRRILIGLAAAAGAMLVIGVLTPDAYRQAAAGSTWHAWGHAMAVYLSFYLGFTAWTEAGIGFAALAGLRLPENFDRPHLAYGLADFWRRWNVTLGRWMLLYVYLPLAPRGRPTRAFAWYGTAAVFSSVAVYHLLGGLKLLGPGLASMPGFWIPWLVWAGLNTVGVRLTQTWQAPAALTPGALLVALATVGVAALGMTIVFFPIELPLDLLGTTVARMLIPTR